MSEKKETFMDRVEEKEAKISKFSELLDSLENTEDKKKLLWKEVSQNGYHGRRSDSVLRIGSTGPWHSKFCYGKVD